MPLTSLPLSVGLHGLWNFFLTYPSPGLEIGCKCNGVTSYIYFRPVLGCINASVSEERLILQYFLDECNLQSFSFLHSSCFILLRDVLEAKSEQTKIACPKNKQPNMPKLGLQKIMTFCFLTEGELQ